MKELFKKHREIIVYIICGGITTAVALVVYLGILYTVEHLGGISSSSPEFYIVRSIAQVIQWIVGVLVAFVTNKAWVFNYSKTRGKEALRELGVFALGRVGTFWLDTALTFSTVWLLGAVNYVPFKFIVTFTADFWSKIVAGVAVVIVNYLLSKFIVFKKK